MSDAGAARVARADRSSSTVPVSSRLLGPVAETRISLSPSSRSSPRARGKGRAQVSQRTSTSECETNGRDPPRWGDGRGLGAGAEAGGRDGRPERWWGAGGGAGSGVWRRSTRRGRRLRMAGTAEGWHLQEEAGVLLQRGEPFLSSSLSNALSTPLWAPGPL